MMKLDVVDPLYDQHATAGLLALEADSPKVAKLLAIAFWNSSDQALKVPIPADYQRGHAITESGNHRIRCPTREEFPDKPNLVASFG